MDEIDVKILGILKRNARTKYVKIAEAVGLTEGAVRRRMRELVRQGVIRKFTIETTVELEGIVLVRTEPTRTGKATTEIRRVAERVFETSGDYDIAALIQAQTMAELNQKIDEIRKLPDILTTNTLVKLNE
ncbi:MAG: Lrp/AsnC family transcriptional regulator [Candidatus Bathyarchaeota archaeon]|nr:Lrp/AsnC family transcriptional regulator [Candidatus Bathyarchaeota archaeon]